MNTFIVKCKISRPSPGLRFFTLFLLTIALSVTSAAWAAPSLTVNGVAAGGNIQVLSGNYRWLIEEDVTYDIVPGVTCQSAGDPNCLSEKFHKSYLPAIAEGASADPLPNLDGNKRYHVSILADGYAMGGKSFDGSAGNVTVHVNSAPIPTAQIRIFVFNDRFPINGAPDTPEETGLGGWNVLLEDAGGRYGDSGQQISTDAFGNPLGTKYDAAGNVTFLGNGSLTTDANGIVLIQNLVPGKYGIQVVPPNTSWIQTTTLEGKQVIDAWVKANEPPYFTEFGPPGPHVFMGFVQQFEDTTKLTGGATITGTAKSIHNSRPPDFTFHVGADLPGCWIGLNDLSVGRGVGLFAAPCDESSGFSVPNVPDGSYQLAIWDENLDYIFASQAINIENGNCNGGGCALGDVAVFAWFGRIEQHVFNDTNENGFWDAGEQPMFEQPTALRWRDGTIYQGFPTDLGGAAPYDEVFPFFSWLVAEVGFDRFKATGATMFVDDGGAITPSDPFSFDGVLNPQPQANGLSYRTELGPVLTQGVQTFLGQTNIIQWGKTPYAPGENGGISGVIYYAVTRAEDDPALAAPELWEPGIPRIQLALYQDNVPAGGNGVIDDINGIPGIQIADVDNYPFGNFPGAEDFDYNSNTIFDAGDALQITTTDSWDDNLPTDCRKNNSNDECFDGLAVFNQVRPAVFDGGYAFSSYVPGGVDTGNAEVDQLPAGIYIVATGEHPVYKTVREEDRNIDFGEVFTPDPNLLPPPCVGDLHTVSSQFSLFPLLDENGNPDSPFMAGSDTPLCDQKKVLLANGQNKAADFYMFTLVPVASKITGFILDDTANEFDSSSPTFGEKYGPPYLPVSIRDWTGREYGRTYSDRWGTFNAVLPSTYTTNVASSSGMSPNMVTTCMNDPGPIPNGAGGFMTDPQYDPQYSQFCYNFQYMPGVTTYLDTPVLPVAAFAGPNQQLLECRDDDGTPVIGSVIGSMNGPYVSTTVGGQNGRPFISDGTQSITVTSVVDTTANPRDFGFGSSPGTIMIGETPLTNVAWSNGSISASVPVGTRTGQLTITRSDTGASNVAGITVTIGGPVVQVSPGGSIQQAIDLADAGDLVLVPPGDFLELVIMHKPVRLQGSGALTTISAIKQPTEKLEAWRQTVLTLEGTGAFDLLPSQGVDTGPLGTPVLGTEEGPGVIVLGRSGINQAGGFGAHPSHIDGFSITGSDNSGAIVVNGYAEDLVVSNNRIFGNSGIYGGGVRVGHPELFLTQNGNFLYQDGFNDNIRIHHNVITRNGGNGGAGGGISLYHGTENYEVTDNLVCGNFSQSDGGGIGHYGLSDNGLIANNVIHHNQSFTQLGRPAGGGIFIGGAPDIQGGLTAGAGSVDIVSNVIQGNQAGAGDGGGIALTAVNGELQGTDTANWHKISILNNLIVNNQTAMSGGGISLRDTVLVDVINNTVAHNESTATAGDAFNVTGGNSNISSPQPAGIVSYAHSSQLNTEISAANGGSLYGNYARPVLYNNIIWRNRSFFFEIDRSVVPAIFGLQNAVPYYNDLAVVGAGGAILDPRSCLLTDAAGYSATNKDGSSINPADLFSSAFVNTGVGETIQQVELTTSIGSQPAFDEGGNFIQVRFGPLSLAGDYHLDPTAAGGALVVGQGDPSVAPANDIDGEPRTAGADVLVDIGADEAPSSGPPVPTLPTITSPSPGSVLAGLEEIFNWAENSTNVVQWWVYAGTSARNKTHFDSGSLTTQTSINVTGLPTDGSTVYVTLWYRESGGAWKTVVETYTAATITSGQ